MAFNVVLGAVALQGDLRNEAARLFSLSVSHIQDVYGSGESKTYKDDENGCFVFNNLSRSCWTASRWHERNGDLCTFTAPPVYAHSMQSGISDQTWRDLYERKDINKYHPGWAGISVNSGRLSLFSDRIGLGRFYYVCTDKFLAGSNCISALLYFLDGPVEVDKIALHQYAGLNWIAGNRSPFKGVTRLPPATSIEGSINQSVRKLTVSDISSLTKPELQNPAASYDLASESMRSSVANLNNMLASQPKVALSGGKDSRLVAASWLASGTPCKLWTNGTLSGEAETARDLIRRLPASIPRDKVVHEISEGNNLPKLDKAKAETHLLEHAHELMRFYDGDVVCTALKGSKPLAVGGTASLGGGGGEIASGSYYSSQIIYDRLKDSDYPFHRLELHFGNHTPGTPKTTDVVQDTLRTVFGEALTKCSHRVATLDYFYLKERLRRWTLTGSNTSSVAILANNEFIKLAFATSPEQKREALVHKALIATLIPEWEKVPFYKAKLTDQKEVVTKRRRLWQRSEHMDVVESLRSNQDYAEFLDPERFDDILDRIATEEAVNVHETNYMKFVWINTFLKYTSELGRKIAQDKRAI